jgi:histidyl-tRNA synthetase
MGEQALPLAAQLAQDLRRQGISAELGYEPIKLKKSLSVANKLRARFAVIIGEGELASGRYQVKDMNTGQQEEVEPARIAQYLQEKLGKPSV